MSAAGGRHTLCEPQGPVRRFPISIWYDPAEDTTRIRWARELWEAMRPFSVGGVYANNLGEEERSALKQPMVRITRLHALKNKCDPTNFFRLN